MSSDRQARELVKKAYPNSVTWPAKVDKMPAGQVMAILFRLRRKGVIP